MPYILRNRVILLALVILIGQLTLVVHATAHDTEFNCQLCLNQTNNAKALPTAKLFVPQVSHQNAIIVNVNNFKSVKTFPNAFSQRGPPIPL